MEERYMGIINQLAKEVSNLIAAGEVVEHVTHVVKELIENSMDAKATSIDIYLEESGLKTIRITDNGIGMNKEDLYKSVDRHATSKIVSADDLMHVKTLGFRGEALASLAAVAELKIVSGTGEEGHVLEVYNQKKSMAKGPSIKGTSVTVNRLFYQTPARLKFIKNPQQELSKTLKTIHQLALSHPSIRFSLTHETTRLFQSSGDGNIPKIIFEIYGGHVTESLFKFSIDDRDYKGHAFFAKPMYHRSNSDSIYLFVNQRSVRNQAILKALKEAYKNYMPVSKYPIGFLYLEADPLLIDVNTHPQKRVVKLAEEKRLVFLLQKECENALAKTQVLVRKKATPTTSYEFLKLEELHHKDVINNSLNETKPSKDQRPFPIMEYVGQVHGTYLVMQSFESMILIDQHAAAERIRYEKYLKSMQTFNGTVQMLTVPLEILLSSVESLDIKPYLNDFKAFGLNVKLRENTLLIESVPHYFHPGKEEEYGLIMIESYLENKRVSRSELVDQMAKDLSCKHSIKGNETISRENVNALIHDLSLCDFPFHCPHGRPTMIEYTNRSLENMFGRIIS
jgi:DNA mismatch repair protein MutL